MHRVRGHASSVGISVGRSTQNSSRLAPKKIAWAYWLTMRQTLCLYPQLLLVQHALVVLVPSGRTSPKRRVTIGSFVLKKMECRGSYSTKKKAPAGLLSFRHTHTTGSLRRKSGLDTNPNASYFVRKPNNHQLLQQQQQQQCQQFLLTLPLFSAQGAVEG